MWRQRQTRSLFFADFYRCLLGIRLHREKWASSGLLYEIKLRGLSFLPAGFVQAFDGRLTFSLLLTSSVALTFPKTL